MESWDHARPLWAHNMTWACKLACMHVMYLHAQDHISAKLGRIREIKVYIESGEHVRCVWAHSLTWACKHACMHAICLCAQAHISANLGLIIKKDIFMEFRGRAGNDYYVWAHEIFRLCCSLAINISLVLSAKFTCLHQTGITLMWKIMLKTTSQDRPFVWQTWLESSI